MKNSYTGFIASIIVIFLAVTIFTGCTLFAGSKDDIKTEEASIIVIKKSSDGENVKMNVLVTDGGDEDIEKQIFVTATNDGEIIKKVIKTEKNGDEKEMKVEVIVTNDGEKHIIKDHGKKIIFISDDDEDFEITIDPEDLEDLEKLEELEDIDFNFDFDFDDDFESTKIVITKDGVKKEIWIDTENMKEFTDQLKELKELNEDIIVDIQVLDDDNDIIIISDSDDHSKKIQKIIIKSNSDEELGKIKVIEEIDIGKIQDELVKDGIIKEKSEELIIFIDDDVIKINDKEIPAEHKEKYKKLLGGF